MLRHNWFILYRETVKTDSKTGNDIEMQIKGIVYTYRVVKCKCQKHLYYWYQECKVSKWIRINVYKCAIFAQMCSLYALKLQNISVHELASIESLISIGMTNKNTFINVDSTLKIDLCTCMLQSNNRWRIVVVGRCRLIRCFITWRTSWHESSYSHSSIMWQIVSMSCHFMSCHVITDHVMSFRVMSWYFMSCINVSC